MTDAAVAALRGGLPPLQRLALAYAPAAAKAPWLALLALDSRLGGIVRNSHEPMLAQLRLAWWREQLAGESGSWPEGEPLFAALRSWGGGHRPLAALADGWELMTGAAPLPAETIAAFADARAQGFAALAAALGREAEAAVAARLGREWALADVAAKVAHPQERAAARALALACDWRGARIARAMRPLAVLHGLARRDLRGGREGATSRLLAAMRLGLFGR